VTSLTEFHEDLWYRRTWRDIVETTLSSFKSDPAVEHSWAIREAEARAWAKNDPQMGQDGHELQSGFHIALVPQCTSSFRRSLVEAVVRSVTLEIKWVRPSADGGDTGDIFQLSWTATAFALGEDRLPLLVPVWGVQRAEKLEQMRRAAMMKLARDISWHLVTSRVAFVKYSVAEWLNLQGPWWMSRSTNHSSYSA
jgi:hypothetical protein